MQKTALIRGTTMEERARDLAKTGRVASAGAVWRTLGCMVYNSEEMLRAREITREMKEQAKRDKQDKADKELEDLFDKASPVYEEYVENGECISSLGRGELQTLVKFICKIENKKNDAPSKYNNMTKMKERLEKCEPTWTKYFMPVEWDDDNNDVEGGNDLTQEMNDENENDNQNLQEESEGS